VSSQWKDASFRYREQFGYAPDGQLAKIAYDDGSAVTFEYDGNANLVRVTDEEGLSTILEYGSHHELPTKVIDATFGTREMTYDTFGRPLAIRGATVTQLTYDDVARKQRITLPSGRSIEYQLGLDDNVVRKRHVAATGFFGISDPVTTYEYDFANRLRRVTTPSGTVTDYERNPLGQLQRILCDGLPVGQTYSYNADGTLAAVGDGPRHMTFNYNSNGLLDSLARDGVVAESYSYTPGDWLASIAYPDGTIKSYTYYPTGHVRSVAEGTRRVTYERDNRCRVAAEITDPGHKEHRATYLKNGRLNSLDGIVYTRNAQGLISQVRYNGQLILNSYNDLGQLIDRSTPNGFKQKYVYDPDGRVSGIVTGHTRYNVEFDSRGNPKRFWVKGTTQLRALRFVSDAENRLRVFDEGGISQVAYEYDGRGNLVEEKPLNGPAVKRIHSGANELVRLEAGAAILKISRGQDGRVEVVE